MMRNDRSFIPAMQFATVPDGKRSETPEEEPQSENPVNAAATIDHGQVWMYLQDNGSWEFKRPDEKRKEMENEGPMATFNYWN
ncbi:hypothetical protein RUND412_010310 [Rhizina undulata]